MAEDALLTLGATALGGTLALAGSWFMDWRQEKKRRKEQEQVLTKLRHAILCEANSLMLNYMNGIGQALLASDRGPFLYTFPVNQDYFPIYNANADRLILLEDSIRDCIIETYASAKALIDCYLYNNTLVRRYDDISSAHFTCETEAATGAKQYGLRAVIEELTDYRETLLNYHAIAISNYERLKNFIENGA